MNKKFDVLLERDSDGGFVVSVPALPGCYSQGDTLKEATSNIKEAIELYLKTSKEKKKKTVFNFVGVSEVVVNS